MSNGVLSLFVFFTGLIVVFLGITILILCVYGVGAIMKRTGGKESKEKVKVKEEPKAVASADEGEIPAHVKAAIVAAVTAYYGSAGNSECEFRVKKIKRLY